jgi:hypothetical protein
MPDFSHALAREGVLVEELSAAGEGMDALLERADLRSYGRARLSWDGRREG